MQTFLLESSSKLGTSEKKAKIDSVARTFVLDSSSRLDISHEKKAKTDNDTVDFKSASYKDPLVIYVINNSSYLILFKGLPKRLIKIPNQIFHLVSSGLELHFINIKSLNVSSRAIYDPSKIYVAIFYQKEVLFQGHLFANSDLKIGTKSFSGGKYIGELVHGVAEGKGCIYYSDYIYEGRFSKNRPIELGEIFGGYKQREGFKFRGAIYNGKLHGKGEVIFDNNEKYTGDFASNTMNGWGIYFYKNGDKYIGQFKNNQRHGKGDLIYENGNRFTGYWSQDFPSGDGTLYTSMYIIEGYWEQFTIKGFGKIIKR